MPYCIQCEIGARCAVNQRPPGWIYCVYMPCPEVPVLHALALFPLCSLDLNYNTLNKWKLSQGYLKSALDSTTIADLSRNGFLNVQKNSFLGHFILTVDELTHKRVWIMTWLSMHTLHCPKFRNSGRLGEGLKPNFFAYNTKAKQCRFIYSLLKSAVKCISFAMSVNFSTSDIDVGIVSLDV